MTSDVKTNLICFQKQILAYVHQLYTYDHHMICAVMANKATYTALGLRSRKNASFKSVFQAKLQHVIISFDPDLRKNYWLFHFLVQHFLHYC